jgi:hypothetical protein
MVKASIMHLSNSCTYQDGILKMMAHILFSVYQDQLLLLDPNILFEAKKNELLKGLKHP